MSANQPTKGYKMLSVTCDGFKVEINKETLDGLFEIPITPFDGNYWDSNHMESLSIDLESAFVGCVINYGPHMEEVHQICADGIHHFSVRQDKWLEFTQLMK